jgi:hypothetical protein
MLGAIPPLPNTASWCGAQLKHKENFTFNFTSQFCLEHTVFLSSSKQIPRYYRKIGEDRIPHGFCYYNYLLFDAAQFVQ